MTLYRSDQLLRLLQTLDRRTQTEEDAMALDENTIQDVFYPLSEQVAVSDSVDVAFYDPTRPLVWGGRTNQATLQAQITDWSTSTANGVDLSV